MQANRVLIVLVVAALAAAAAAQKDNAEARAAVEAAGKTFAEASAAGDAAKMAALYAEDAQAFPPNGEMVTGRAAIEEMWRGALNSGIKKIDITSTEVQQSGDYAYETGKYNITGEAGKHLDHGKYVVVWKKQNGEWKMFRDIWNSDMPTAPAGH